MLVAIVISKRFYNIYNVVYDYDFIFLEHVLIQVLTHYIALILGEVIGIKYEIL